MTRVDALAQAALALGLLIAYTVLTALNHDADAVLAVLVGQLGGAAATHVANTAAPSGER